MSITQRTLRLSVHVERYEEVSHWKAQAVWVVALGILGFTISFLFSSVLELSRNWFVATYLAIAAPVVFIYMRMMGVDARQLLLRHWKWGVVGAVIVGTALAFSVQRMDASPRAQGMTFALQIVWLGVVYGLLDAILLNVLPVVAVWRASRELGHTTTWAGKIGTGAVAVLASLFVTAAYHFGYAEYRNSDIVDPLFGNMIMTLGYILSTNPITALVSHVVLHVASVIHGVESTVTLPPHY